MSDFHGLFVALATPFDSNGNVDLDGFRKVVRHVAGGGADVLVPLGSTGEAATLDDPERDAVVTACLEEAGGKPVIVGTGSNNTRQAVRWTARAKELGAQGALVVTPYYNKPMPNGLVDHFDRVAEAATGLPIIAYNVPSRTGQNVTKAILDRLWKNPQVVAVKESSGDLLQIGSICADLPAGKRVLSGDDNLSLPALAVGASGLVSVLGNLLPGPMKEMVDHAMSGRLEEARSLFHRLLPVMCALFVESNPIALKSGLDLMGIAGDYVRLPLTHPEPGTRETMAAVLSDWR